MNLFNLSIDIKKINKETTNILKVLKNVKHKPTTIYKTQLEKSNERKQNINNMLNKRGFRK